MRDGEIREALVRKELSRHARDAGTLIVHELGLEHGSARVDIAVVNGKLHGFEIKSAADTLERLPGQVAAYAPVFDRVTVVCAQRHLLQVKEIIPAWWGIKIAEPGRRGAIHFRTERPTRQNRQQDALRVARLLWRDEALCALERLAGVRRGIKGKSREALYRLMVELLPLQKILEFVRETLKFRALWRPDAMRT